MPFSNDEFVNDTPMLRQREAPNIQRQPDATQTTEMVISKHETDLGPVLGAQPLRRAVKTGSSLLLLALGGGTGGGGGGGLTNACLLQGRGPSRAYAHALAGQGS